MKSCIYGIIRIFLFITFIFIGWGVLLVEDESFKDYKVEPVAAKIIIVAISLAGMAGVVHESLQKRNA